MDECIVASTIFAERSRLEHGCASGEPLVDGSGTVEAGHDDGVRGYAHLNGES